MKLNSFLWQKSIKESTFQKPKPKQNNCNLSILLPKRIDWFTFKDTVYNVRSGVMQNIDTSYIEHVARSTRLNKKLNLSSPKGNRSLDFKKENHMAIRSIRSCLDHPSLPRNSRSIIAHGLKKTVEVLMKSDFSSYQASLCRFSDKQTRYESMT